MKVRFRPELAIPAAIVLAFVLLGLFGFATSLDNRVYDLLLSLKRAPKEDKSLLLVDFDDKSVSKIGTWPISREIMADALMLLRECGASYAVFDIEYLNKSPRGVNSEVLKVEIPENFSTEFGAIGENMKQLVDALAQGNIPLREAGSYVSDFQSQVLGGAQGRLLTQVERVARDNDEYLAESIRFFGKAFLTVNLQDARDPNVPEADRRLAVETFALKGLTFQGRLPPAKIEILPPIQPIAPAAKGLGFTNVVIDSDGVRRKIDLLGRYGEAWFPQLAFGPLLDWMGHPTIVATPRSITLKGARFPDGTVRDLRIPLDPEGRLIINWPHKRYGDSFRHLSFLDLVLHKENLDNLVYALKNREGWGYFSLYTGEKGLLDQYREAELLREAIMTGKESPDRAADFRAMRERFLSELGSFLDSRPEDKIGAAVAAVLKDPKSSKAVKDQYRTIGADAPEYFKGLRTLYGELERIRKGIIAQAEGSFAVLGWTSTGSTDIGVNPFDANYANVGTHAAVTNTILNRDFIDVVPAWGSALAAMILAAALVLALQNTKPIVTITAGAGATASILVIGGGFFLLTGIYMPLMTPLGATFFTFLALSATQFLKTEREKGFIRNAFSHYLSEEVIKTIVGDPNKLKLGGELREMTAVFTDIKGFST
ncbi:MAG TPA: CHASE2 domain-containing protein, partial [Rectinemataceae bacterium]|nr:CHASE2 domain-containing protein [Rectinemataceae bacterium]